MICTASWSLSSRCTFPSSASGTSSFSQSAESRRTTSPSGRAARAALGGEDLEEVADVDQPTRALAQEELTGDDAALVEDPRVERARAARAPRPRASQRDGRRAGDRPRRRGRREIGQREPEERRQPGAQALGGIARIGDGAQEIPDLTRLGRGVETLLVVDDRGDAARAERAGDGLCLDPGSRQHEDVASAQRFRRQTEVDDFVRDRLREALPNGAHRQPRDLLVGRHAEQGDGRRAVRLGRRRFVVRTVNDRRVISHVAVAEVRLRRRLIEDRVVGVDDGAGGAEVPRQVMSLSRRSHGLAAPRRRSPRRRREIRRSPASDRRPDRGAARRRSSKIVSKISHWI